ncbi:MAG: MBL fold metallo-hydrolase, partial [Odoribacter sp.]|nr:MBL fold metallo-hydrolase [Odoribacter sp.]
MDYKIFVNNPWQENTIVLYDETGEAAVVDCGCFSKEEEVRLQEFLQSENLRPVLLLNTHLHPDHVFGNRWMKDVYGLSTCAAREDDFLLEHAVEFAAMLGLKGVTPPPAAGESIRHGDVVRFGASEMQVIAVGGHSPGGLCFYSERDKLLLSGDVLFAGSVGRSDFPGGNGEELLAGIRER